MTTSPKYDPAPATQLIARARALITPPEEEEFPFPNERVVELAMRLVAAGPKAHAVSASECHEITDAVITAYDKGAFPSLARKVIKALIHQLEAALQATREEPSRAHGDLILKKTADGGFQLRDYTSEEAAALDAALQRIDREALIEVCTANITKRRG